MRLLVACRPTIKDQIVTIPGIKKSKCESFWEDFLKQIRCYWYTESDFRNPINWINPLWLEKQKEWGKTTFYIRDEQKWKELKIQSLDIVSKIDISDSSYVSEVDGMFLVDKLGFSEDELKWKQIEKKIFGMKNRGVKNEDINAWLDGYCKSEKIKEYQRYQEALSVLQKRVGTLKVYIDTQSDED